MLRHARGGICWGAVRRRRCLVGGLRAGRDCDAVGTAAGALLRGAGGTSAASAASAAYIAAYVGASCGGGGGGAQGVSLRLVICFLSEGGFFIFAVMGECFKICGCGGAQKICRGRASSGVLSAIVFGFAGLFLVCFFGVEFA
jgi:hypothetical protein